MENRKDLSHPASPFDFAQGGLCASARDVILRVPTTCDSHLQKPWWESRTTVRAILYYPLTNGRNIDEILRLLTAIQTTDEYKVATPANWQPGEDVVVPPPGSCDAAEERVEKAGADYRCLDWFLCLKKDPGR